MLQTSPWRAQPAAARAASGSFPEKHALQNVLAARVSHRLAQPLEREVAQRVGGDVAGDLVGRVGGGDELLARRRVDAVVAGPAWWAGLEMRRCTSRAPAALSILTIFREVVPRTIESSTTTTRLPLSTCAHRRQLQLHAEVADGLLRLDERAAHVVAADEPHVVGNARSPGEKPMAAGTPESGTAMTRSASARAARCASCRPSSLRVSYTLLPEQHRVRLGEVDVLEDAAARPRAARRAAAMRRPLLVDDHHLAGLELADVLGLDQVQRGGLAGQHVGVRAAARAPAAGSRTGRAPPPADPR